MVKNFIDRIKNSLKKTREQFVSSLSGVLPVGRKITDDVLDEVEEILYSADIGVHAAEQLIEELRRSAVDINRGKTDPFSVMKTSVLSLISRVENDKGLLLNKGLKPLAADPLVAEPHVTVGGKRPFVILVVGVNGTGKTTSIGKLAMRLRKEGKSVLLAACDTFRAAAVEQLEVWAHRAGAEFLRAQTGADPAAVAFDAVQRAKARSTDVVLIDTAGRIHTSKNLMEELKKIDKVLRKAEDRNTTAETQRHREKKVLRQDDSLGSGSMSDSAPFSLHETLLVLDATTGQNALNQAEVFGGSLKITGIILTKLDGTAKGGIVISIIDRLGIPIKLIGVGEGIDDLRDFDAVEFVNALFEK